MGKGCDGDFHLETSTLQHELHEALKEDVRRKKTDAMKKRAIHTAGSYDEFRHMVSCAQLHPVTRKEMDMLSDRKRGWTGRPGAPASAASGSRTRKNVRRTSVSHKGERNQSFAERTDEEEGVVRPPKDFPEFWRAWRRQLHTDGERRAFLDMIGPDRLCLLFRVELEPDLLAEIVSLTCSNLMSSKGGEAPVSAITDAPQYERKERCRTKPVNSELDVSIEAVAHCMKWLEALSRTGRFGMNVNFMAKKEKEKLNKALDTMAANLLQGAGEFTLSRVSALRQTYALSSSRSGQ